MSFFNVCSKCKKMFTDEKTYKDHLSEHVSGKSKDVQPIPEEKPKPVIAIDETAKLNELTEKNRKKKILIHSGVEAQTMNDEEVEKRYIEEKKKGNVR